MKIVIAEKPDQAAKLAAPFSFIKKSGYFEVRANSLFPKGAIIVWAIGHLCELKPPEEYNPLWKKWSIETLPMIPDLFEYRVANTKKKPFSIIKNILNRKDITEIIIAGDAGREGELIIRTIIRLCGVNKPMKRLWISSLTEGAVKKGFSHLLTEEETRSIYYEALSRTCADWLIGINASRVYTILLTEKGLADVFSIGRVQTPTLALIVKREQEIANFQSKPFFEVKATFDFNGSKLTGIWHKNNETRIFEEKQAKAIADFCKDKAVKITNITKEKKEYKPPFLFNLSALQATANKGLKFPPQKTLDILQKLYLKGYISYPRSDSQFLTKEEAVGLPNILNQIRNITKYKDFFPLPYQSILNNKRYVNEKKVTDHHAIIPTEQIPIISKLTPDEEKIYALIVKRLIAAHYPPAITLYTTVHSLVDSRAEFMTKGKEQLEEGWRRLFNGTNENVNKDVDQKLPHINENEIGTVANLSINKGETQPPNRYTEGNLITLMKTAGKHIDNAQLEKVLAQTEGLGTEATRAGIINLLKARNYIQIKHNQVYATKKGMILIEALGESILTSPSMTAKWEQRLSEISSGTASPQNFIGQVKLLSQKLVTDAKEQATKWSFDQNTLKQLAPNSVPATYKKISKTPLGKCKLCNGTIIDLGKFYGCSNYKLSNCTFSISKKILGKTISKANLKKLLEANETNLIKGFKKKERTFDAKLTWNEKEKKTEFRFMNKIK